MGKWASYQKRGRAKLQGYLSPPAAADWSIGTTTTTTVPANRSAAYPPGASEWRTRCQLTAGGGTIAYSPITSGTLATITGLTTGTSYQVQAAWFANNATQVSDWSTSKTAVTL